ncbi:glycosyltransferase family 2 protein [Rubricoccus marinus]|uniref:glycosyltransferase family 2 protein n=1 Tax=Rubricoccus marinus TaxID=716817 RepID=UPI0015C637A7|nr:glycosyltransferase family 2 protein [Rubricoccus marinus]
MIEILFWTAAAVLFYTYIGYGLLAALLVRLRGRRPAPEAFAEWPAATVVVAAYNEAAYIGEKVRNTLGQDYPSDLRLLVVADGSTDATAEIAREAGAEVLFEPERRGKIAAMHRALAHVDTPLVAFTDANAMLETDGLRHLLAPFADPTVGAVAGEKRVRASANGASGEGLYWRYESALKKLDSQLHSVVGAAGELFALRTPLAEPVEPDTILDDFVLSLRVAEKGWRVAYAPEACATEAPSASMEDEWTRKVRICAGGWQAMSRLRGLCNPFRHGLLTLQYVSHRVLRWTLAPVLLPLALILNIVLAPEAGVYAALLAAQVAFYAVAALGWALREREVPVRGFRLPLYVVFMHAAVFPGVLRFLTGQQSVNWARARRAV